MAAPKKSSSKAPNRKPVVVDEDEFSFRGADRKRYTLPPAADAKLPGSELLDAALGGKLPDAPTPAPVPTTPLPDDFDDLVANAEANRDLSQLRQLLDQARRAGNENAIRAVTDAGRRAKAEAEAQS